MLLMAESVLQENDIPAEKILLCCADITAKNTIEYIQQMKRKSKKSIFLFL